MVNFGLLSAEILSLVWAPLQISTGFASWQHYCTASRSGRQPHLAALNRGRHLCSAGRPSRWALAHISSVQYCLFSTDRECYWTGSCDLNHMIFWPKKSFDFNHDLNQWLKSARFKSANSAHRWKVTHFGCCLSGTIWSRIPDSNLIWAEGKWAVLPSSVCV